MASQAFALIHQATPLSWIQPQGVLAQCLVYMESRCLSEQTSHSPEELFAQGKSSFFALDFRYSRDFSYQGNDVFIQQNTHQYKMSIYQKLLEGSALGLEFYSMGSLLYLENSLRSNFTEQGPVEGADIVLSQNLLKFWKVKPLWLLKARIPLVQSRGTWALSSELNLPNQFKMELSAYQVTHRNELFENGVDANPEYYMRVEEEGLKLTLANSWLKYIRSTILVHSQRYTPQYEASTLTLNGTQNRINQSHDFIWKRLKISYSNEWQYLDALKDSESWLNQFALYYAMRPQQYLSLSWLRGTVDSQGLNRFSQRRSNENLWGNFPNDFFWMSDWNVRWDDFRLDSKLKVGNSYWSPFVQLRLGEDLESRQDSRWHYWITGLEIKNKTSLGQLATGIEVPLGFESSNAVSGVEINPGYRIYFHTQSYF